MVMKAFSNVIKWNKHGAVVKRGKKVICYDIETHNQHNPNHWTFSQMEITERIYNGADCYPWREVYAWWPVKTINNKYVWLRKVYKQRFWAVWGTGFHMEPCVEYAELFDILTE